MKRDVAALLMVSALCVATCVATCAAADAATGIAGICASLPDGAAVRVVLRDGAETEGRVAGWDGAVLLLMTEDGGTAACAEVDMISLWKRESHAKGGAKVGAVTGGIVGCLGAAMLAVLIDAMDNYGDGGSHDGTDDQHGDDVMQLVVTGTSAGAVLGALLGGTAGSALPDWKLLWTRPGIPAALRSAAVQRRLRSGGLEVLIGSASARRWPQDDGLAFAGRWRAKLSPRVWTALEVARHDVDAYEPVSMDLGGSTPGGDVACWQAGVLLQANLALGEVRPYVVGGLGEYWWRENFLGGSWGGGLEAAIDPRTVVRLEYRRHGNLQRLAGADPTLESMMVGVAMTW